MPARCAPAGGQQEAQAEAALQDAAQDGQAGHGLPDHARCLLQVPVQAPHVRHGRALLRGQGVRGTLPKRAAGRAERGPAQSVGHDRELAAAVAD